MAGSDLAPPLPDKELPDDVRTARRAAEAAFERSRRWAPTVQRRIDAYRRSLEELALFFRVPLDTGGLELDADTRWTALWQLSARSINLAHCLLAQVEAGFGEEAYATSRALNETNRLILVFCDPEEEGLLREWLAGRAIKAATLRKAVARVEARDDQRRAAAGDEPIEPAGSLELDLYRALSTVVHPTRGSTASGVSLTRRTLLMGPEPDWGRRASHVAWVGMDVAEVMRSCVRSLAALGGQRFVDEIGMSLIARFEAIDEEIPLPERYQRESSLELDSEEAAAILRRYGDAAGKRPNGRAGRKKNSAKSKRRKR